MKPILQTQNKLLFITTLTACTLLLRIDAADLEVNQSSVLTLPPRAGTLIKDVENDADAEDKELNGLSEPIGRDYRMPTAHHRDYKMPAALSRALIVDRNGNAPYAFEAPRKLRDTAKLKTREERIKSLEARKNLLWWLKWGTFGAATLTTGIQLGLPLVKDLSQSAPKTGSEEALRPSSTPSSRLYVPGGTKTVGSLWTAFFTSWVWQRRTTSKLAEQQHRDSQILQISNDYELHLGGLEPVTFTRAEDYNLTLSETRAKGSNKYHRLDGRDLVSPRPEDALPVTRETVEDFLAQKSQKRPVIYEADFPVKEIPPQESPWWMPWHRRAPVKTLEIAELHVAATFEQAMEKESPKLVKRYAYPLLPTGNIRWGKGSQGQSAEHTESTRKESFGSYVWNKTIGGFLNWLNRGENS